MAGLSPEAKIRGAGTCVSYLGMQEATANAMEVAGRTGRSRGVGDYSPELLLRRSSGVVVLLVAPGLKTNKEKCERLRREMVE